MKSVTIMNELKIDSDCQKKLFGNKQECSLKWTYESYGGHQIIQDNKRMGIE